MVFVMRISPAEESQNFLKIKTKTAGKCPPFIFISSLRKALVSWQPERNIYVFVGLKPILRTDNTKKNNVILNNLIGNTYYTKSIIFIIDSITKIV